MDLSSSDGSAAAIESLRIATLVKSVMPLLGYACIVGLIQSKLASRLQTSIDRAILTDVYSRRYLIEKGEEVLRKARRSVQDPAALLLITLDNFKAINERWGHDIGDQVLKQCARCIQSTVADQSSIVCRFVGEEFCVLIPSASRESLALLADRIRVAIAFAPYQNGHIQLNLEVSIRRAQHPEASSVNASVALADAGLYRGQEIAAISPIILMVQSYLFE
jgi:two-component system, cell cycle response regulator